MQKTYHSQTAKFLAMVAQNMPEISADVMQGWIENPKGLKKVLAEVLCPPEPTRKWREEDGVIYFSVTSDGTTGEEWITRLEKKGFRVGDQAKRILLSPCFSPTEYVMTEVAVFKRRFLFGEKCNWVTTDDLHTEADNRNLEKPNTEVACLIREKFTDKEIEAMDITDIVTMHEPINDLDGVQWQLVVLDLFRSSRLFEACSVTPSYEWHGDRVGFAFAKSQEKYIPRPW